MGYEWQGQIAVTIVLFPIVFSLDPHLAAD
jgi:hypothetical protein